MDSGPTYQHPAYPLAFAADQKRASEAETLIDTFLSSNVPPEEADRDNITRVRLSRVKQIADIDTQIAWLLEERARLVCETEDCAKVLSPLRRFPTEILEEIFFSTLVFDPNAPEFLDIAAADNRNTIWVVAEVCQRWREVALNFSKLWSYFYVRFDPRQRAGIDERMVLRQINRVSENSDLSITIDMAGFETGTSEAPTPFPLGALCDRLHRCTSFRVVVFYPSQLLSFLHVAPRLTSLRTLYIQTFRKPSGYFFDDVPPESDLFRVFKSASTLVITYSNVSLFHFHLHWPTLAKYKGGCYGFCDGPAQEHLMVLERSPNLTECVLRCQGRPPDSVHTLRHDCLRELSVTGDFLILHALNLPNLETLTVIGMPPNAVIRSFIARSRCFLKTFRIFDTPMSPQDPEQFVALLKSMPTLIELEVSDMFPAVVTLFLNAAADDGLLPCLSRLSIQCTSRRLPEVAKILVAAQKMAPRFRVEIATVSADSW